MGNGSKLVIDQRLINALQEEFRRCQSEAGAHFDIHDALGKCIIPPQILRGEEGLLLFGHRPGSDGILMFEQPVGEFVAIQTGFVEFSAFHSYREMSGLIQRVGTEIWGLCACDYAGLHIRPTSFNDGMSEEQCRTYPMVINWYVHRDDGGQFFIPAERWSVMKEWFDRWLPAVVIA